MKDLRAFGRDVVIIAISNVLITLKGLVSLPFLSKTLDVSSYGMWSQISITSSLLIPIITLGLPIGVVRFLASEDDKQKISHISYSVVLFTCIVSSVVALFINVFPTQISSFLGLTNTLLVRYLSYLVIVDSLALVSINIFRALRKINLYATLLVSGTFAEIGVIALVVSIRPTLENVVISVFAVRLLFLIIQIGILIKIIGLVLFHLSGIKEIINYSIYTISGNISSWIIKSSDRYFINLFLGITFVGYYSPAYQFSMILMLVITPLTFVLPVFLSRFYDSDNIRDIQTFLSYSTKYYLIISVPAAVVLSIMSKDLLTMLSTNEIAEHSYFVIPFIMAAMICLGLKSIYSQIFLVVKKTKINALVWISGAILNLALNFLLIPPYKLMGAALSTIVAYVATLIMAVALSRRYIQFHVHVAPLAKISLFSFILGLALYLYQPKTMLQISIAVLFFAIAYTTLLYFSKSIGAKELDYFKRLFSFRKLGPRD